MDFSVFFNPEDFEKLTDQYNNNKRNLKNLYREYFQKSKVFLYPLIGIKKGVMFVPDETYMGWENLYDVKDNKLILLYKIPNKRFQKYQLFEENYLKQNKKYIGTIQLKGTKNICHLAVIFDLEVYKWDIKKLINGQYSKISLNAKETITDFFGEHGAIAEYVESYLHPTYWHGDYADLLNVSIETIEDAHELCDLPDLKKECFKYKSEEIEIFKKKFLSLQS
jgi:hypothetical protein